MGLEESTPFYMGKGALNGAREGVVKAKIIKEEVVEETYYMAT